MKAPSTLRIASIGLPDDNLAAAVLGLLGLGAMMRAATYLRSSKDRSDVSIAAQRHELALLAKTRQLRLVAEFADAVESGKNEDREGFQALLRAIRNPRRGWDTLLVLDTSRIARRQLHAVIFEEQTCRQAGVRILYKSLPESDPVTEMLLKSVLRAWDEWHSMTSRAKGLAGMRQNVRQGFCAGGRAPLGYQLEAIETGTVREGVPVRKSKLVTSADASKIRAFLRARATGVPRAKAGLSIAATSQVGIEWNALTYAGHTVWNVHAEHGSGRKRRPRAEWVVQRNTHEALITDEEAETIIKRLEAYAPKRGRQRGCGYLLAGLLVTADGKVFHGDRGSYATKGRCVKAAELDAAVTAHVMQDLQQPAFVRAVTKAARGLDTPDHSAGLRASLAAVEKRLARVVGLLEQTNEPGPLLRQMEVLEVERGSFTEALAIADAESEHRRALSRISEHEVRRLLVERAEAIEEASPETLRETLQGLLSKVELDGNDLRIHYRIHRDKVASPRGFEPRSRP